MRITAAPRSHHDDQHARIVKYIVSMSVRIVCLVLAFVTSGPLQWVMVAGAVVLPYVAVVLANAGRERTEDPSSYATVPPAHPELPGARPASGAAPASGSTRERPRPDEPGEHRESRSA